MEAREYVWKEKYKTINLDTLKEARDCSMIIIQNAELYNEDFVNETKLNLTFIQKGILYQLANKARNTWF